MRHQHTRIERSSGDLALLPFRVTCGIALVQKASACISAQSASITVPRLKIRVKRTRYIATLGSRTSALDIQIALTSAYFNTSQQLLSFGASFQHHLPPGQIVPVCFSLSEHTQTRSHLGIPKGKVATAPNWAGTNSCLINLPEPVRNWATNRNTKYFDERRSCQG